jgi:hypothetical protein
MNNIFKNKRFDIKKENNSYFLSYNKDDKVIIDFILSKNYNITQEDNQEDSDKEIIKLNNVSITTLKNKLEENLYMLSYNDIEKLLLSLGNQFHYLERNNVIYPFFNIENIIIINDNFYLYLGDYELLEIRDDYIEIDKPYKKTMLFSPQLLNITELPSKISSKSWVYSLGVLATYCLTNNSNLINKEKKYYEDILQHIQNTKVYYCILRCIGRENIFLFI